MSSTASGPDTPATVSAEPSPKPGPRGWTTRAKVLSALAVLILIGAISGGAVAYYRHQTTRACAAQLTVFKHQRDTLSKHLYDATKAIKSVTGRRHLDHTVGFADGEGKKLTDELNAAWAVVNADVLANAPACGSRSELGDLRALTEKRDEDARKLDAAAASFKKARDAYRLASASKEATDAMAKAKSELDSAVKNAQATLKDVDGATGAKSDAKIKAGYDDLAKAVDEATRTDTAVKTTSYEDAVASIDTATKVEARAAALNAKNRALAESLSAHRNGKSA